MKEKFKGTICFDFDGVLNTYDGWKGENELFKPREGAKEIIQELIDLDYRIAIYSTRDSEKLYDWWIKYEMPLYKEMINFEHKETENSFIITSRHLFDCNYKLFEGYSEIFFPKVKPSALLYVDDRGYRFEGNFVEVLIFIKSIDIKPYWEKYKENNVEKKNGIIGY
jgi:hypothetical protein